MLGAVCVALGCSGGGSGGGAASTDAGDAVADDAAADDTSERLDTALEDTALEDTIPADTAVEEDGASDTAEPDGAGEDVAAVEAGDVEADVDAGDDDLTAGPDPELTTCEPWRTSCDGVCRDTRHDEGACGGCGTVCEASEVCDKGACVEPAPAAAPCGPEVVAAVLAEATEEEPRVDLGCSLTLSADDVVTKKLRLRGPAASGVTIDCGGATIRRTLSAGGPDVIRIESEKQDSESGPTWSRPTDVVIRDCRVEGSIRVLGQGQNGEAPDVMADSLTLGHRERAQDAAPTRVLLEGLTVVGDGRIPLYLAPGTTRVTFRDSEIVGRSVATWIYLDAESGHNRILRNRFSGVLDRTPPREHIAVDGSAGNLIAGNRFEGITNGAIYVYRNCGEGGTVRHQEPRRNVIAGNVFVHDDPALINYAIWIGSRNALNPLIDFCDLDDGYDFGSGLSDQDFAGDNVIADNRYVGGEGLLNDDGPTWTAGNVSVEPPGEDAAPTEAPCVVFRDLAAPLLVRDGEVWAERRCEGGRLVALDP